MKTGNDGELRIAGHTLGTPEYGVADAMRLFAAAGLDAAELIWQNDYRSGIPESDNAALLAEIRAVRDELRLPVIGLTPYMTALNSADDSARARDIERFAQCIRDAESLGAGVVRVYAGAYTPEQLDEREPLWQRLVASLGELAPIAQEHGVVLAVENHFNTMTTTAQETADLVAAVAHPAVGILYDQANLTFTHSEAPERALELQRGHIRHVHAKDLIFVDRDRPFSSSDVATVASSERAVRSRAVGDGEMDWKQIIGGLLETGYSGSVSLEYEYRWHPQDLPEPLEGFRRGADAIRSYLRTIAREGESQ
ncbi:MAG: sugar phosphate isomerase/epimerase [Actinomycetota bacterium]|nr:sugar phosphate isomerase/epimerase [Actinomycetota bacterium]